MAQQEYSPCSDCGTLPCKRPKRVLDDCCSCSGEVCGDPACPAIELITCEACNRGDNEMQLILCDGCDHACHLACMDPPVSFVPETWFCRRCLSASLNLNETDGRRVAGQALGSSGRSGIVAQPASAAVPASGCSEVHVILPVRRYRTAQAGGATYGPSSESEEFNPAL
eukprot:716761-Hanusia_phi.AAC.4